MPYYDVVLNGRGYTVSATYADKETLVLSVAEEETGRHLSEEEIKPHMADIVRQVEAWEEDATDDEDEEDE